MVLDAVVRLGAVAGFYAWKKLLPSGPDEGLASGNGRIEAVKVHVSTNLAGRVQSILVDENFVGAGRLLEKMQIDALEAQLGEMRAKNRQALNEVDSAQAKAVVRESKNAATQTMVRL